MATSNILPNKSEAKKSTIWIISCFDFQPSIRTAWRCVVSKIPQSLRVEKLGRCSCGHNGTIFICDSLFLTVTILACGSLALFVTIVGNGSFRCFVAVWIIDSLSVHVGIKDSGSFTFSAPTKHNDSFGLYVTINFFDLFMRYVLSYILTHSPTTVLS